MELREKGKNVVPTAIVTSASEVAEALSKTSSVVLAKMSPLERSRRGLLAKVALSYDEHAC